MGFGFAAHSHARGNPARPASASAPLLRLSLRVLLWRVRTISLSSTLPSLVVLMSPDPLTSLPVHAAPPLPVHIRLCSHPVSARCPLLRPLPAAPPPYILMVPRGPRLVLRTSWRPRAALMLRWRAWPRRATSALGLRVVAAAAAMVAAAGRRRRRQQRRRRRSGLKGKMAEPRQNNCRTTADENFQKVLLGTLSARKCQHLGGTLRPTRKDSGAWA